MYLFLHLLNKTSPVTVENACVNLVDYNFTFHSYFIEIFEIFHLRSLAFLEFFVAPTCADQVYTSQGGEVAQWYRIWRDAVVPGSNPEHSPAHGRFCQLPPGEMAYVVSWAGLKGEREELNIKP
jgi:hypothetical protein